MDEFPEFLEFADTSLGDEIVGRVPHETVEHYLQIERADRKTMAAWIEKHRSDLISIALQKRLIGQHLRDADKTAVIMSADLGMTLAGGFKDRK